MLARARKARIRILCICVFVRLCVCVFVYLCICVFVYLYLCIIMWTHPMMLVTAMKAKIRIVCPLLRAAGHNFDCDAGGWTWSAPSVQPAPFAHQQTLRSHPLACVTLSSTPWRSINIGCDKLSTRHLELGVWYPAGWVPLLHIYVHVNFFTRNGYFPRPRETDPYVHVLSLSPGRYTDLQETKRVHKYWLQKIITKYFIWAQKIIPFLLVLSTH